jgi:hypothetical protein
MKRMGRWIGGVLLLLLGIAGDLHAQDAALHDALRGSVETLARAWTSGNLDGAASQFARGGVSLKLDGPVRTSVAPRQAQAALREFFRGYEGGEIRIVRAALVAGSPDRGFAEVRWSPPAAGGTPPVERGLFLGFLLEGEVWRVDELRHLP